MNHKFNVLMLSLQIQCRVMYMEKTIGMIMDASAIHPKQSMHKIILMLAFILNVAFSVAQTGFPQLTDTTNPVIEKRINVVDELKPTAKLYPNPSKNKVVLQLDGFKPGMAQLQIISDKGSVVRKEDRLLINGNEEVVMFFSLRAGIYFIKTMQGKIEIRKRLVVLD